MEGVLFPHIVRAFPLVFYIAICQYIDMYCVKCFHTNTTVANSRPHKKRPQVWRRRACALCGITFTTYERPSLADNKTIHLPNNKIDSFNLGKLILSISRAFTHSPHDAERSSLWLAQTVEDALAVHKEPLTLETVQAITYTTLKHFDELAAMQYAAQHRMVTSTRRRGRPSLAWREPGIDESPSR